MAAIHISGAEPPPPRDMNQFYSCLITADSTRWPLLGTQTPSYRAEQCQIQIIAYSTTAKIMLHEIKPPQRKNVCVWGLSSYMNIL